MDLPIPNSVEVCISFHSPLPLCAEVVEVKFQCDIYVEFLAIKGDISQRTPPTHCHPTTIIFDTMS